MSNVGTEYKINIGMKPMGEIHLSDCNFSATFYVNSSKQLEIDKDSMIKVDDDNYIARVDSTKTGAGDLKAKVTVHLPDADFDDGFRTEVVTIPTGITIDR